MVSTRWSSAGGRPLLGSGLSTTPEDYGRFLNSYFNGRLVSLETRAEMERSHYPDAALTGVAALQGRYGLGVRALLLPSVDPRSIRQHQTVSESRMYGGTELVSMHSFHSRLSAALPRRGHSYVSGSSGLLPDHG